MTDKLEALSEAFSSLSSTFNSLVDRFSRPDILGIKRIVDSALDNNCEGCRNQAVCWGPAYSDTIETVGKIKTYLHTKGWIDREDLPEVFFSSCPKAERMIKQINEECEQTTESIMRNEKIGSFASNFDDIGAILRDALEGEDDEYECDLSASDKIYSLLDEAGYKIKGVVVFGKRNKRVHIKGLSQAQTDPPLVAGIICKKMSEAVGTPLMGPIFEMSSDGMIMMFYSRPVLRAICSHTRLGADENLSDAAKKAENREHGAEDSSHGSCGDCTRVFVNKNSYFYSLISDGMGSGEEAALSSEVSSMFVEKMLMAGNRADITVRMLNNFLRSENMGLGRESSATLDLFELDLMSGRAAFIKSGAAPTYVYRGGTVYKISSRTMPVGIIKQADAKLTRFDTRCGDIVVMISDGCCPDSEDCPWLADYLSEIGIPVFEDDPRLLFELCDSIRDKIVELAVKNFEGERRDDISVSVILISEQKSEQASSGG